MDSSEKELEEQLLEAGNKLLDPPTSVEELLGLLDSVESCLSKVEQSPTKSIQNAISPSMRALIADNLLRHADVEVKVAVASCISEITRITAPDAPYDDEQMKEVFRLIVSSFENLYDQSSRSYAKRTLMLETVAKVRSCVVMLDLECDDLILDMFQHFLNSIRDHHPENVFSSMETIMNLVLEESEDISLDLLSPVLASVKKSNEEVLPIARKLGERVLESCATKLKPYLKQAVNTLGLSLDDYSDVLASICQDTSGNLEQNDTCATGEHVEDESRSEKKPAADTAQVDRENSEEAALPQPDNPVGDRSPKSVMSNGIAQAGEGDALVGTKSLKKQEDNTDCSVQSEGINLSGNKEPNDLDTEKVHNSEQRPGKSTKGRGKKTSSAKLTEPSEGSNRANDKEDEKMIDSESHSKEVPNSPHEDDSFEAAGPSENDGIDAKISSPKTVDGESNVTPSPSQSIQGKNRSKKRGQPKKKRSSAKEVVSENVLNKVSGGTSGSEAKPLRASVKNGSGRAPEGKKTTVVDAVNKDSGTTGDLDEKKHSAKKPEERNKVGGGSSSRQLEEKKKKGRGKGTSEKGLAKSSTKDEDKELESSPKSTAKSMKGEQSKDTPKTNLKRKRTSGKDNESKPKTKKFGYEVVGARVKVLWPDDEMYYEGRVAWFNPSSQMHKVVYDDGDEETLHLPEETFEIIEPAPAHDSNEGEESDRTSLDGSADSKPKKKGKTSASELKKEGKRGSSKSGGASSSKSKGASGKSSHRSKDGSKSDRKSKDSKTADKSEDDVNRKSKDHSFKSGGGKSIDASQKSKLKNTASSSKTSKSRDDDVNTPKTSAKSKQEAPKAGKSKQEASKTASSSKAKSTKSGAKSTNGTGKVKSNLVKAKDSENENSEDSAEEVEDTKGKSSLKAGGEAKSGKKRGRN